MPKALTYPLNQTLAKTKTAQHLLAVSLKLIPLHRLELCSSAPEADALSTELQGRATKFYHRRFVVAAVQLQQQQLGLC